MLNQSEISKINSDRNVNNKTHLTEKYENNRSINNSLSRQYFRNSKTNSIGFHHSSYSNISNFTFNPNNKNFLKTERHDTLTFDQHTSIINSTMARYEFRRNDNEENLNEIVKIKDLKKGRKSHRISQSLQTTEFLPKICENSEIKIFNYQQDFQNPEQSLHILENNKNIYFKVKKNNHDRQENMYRDTMERIKYHNISNLIKMPRIKILDITNKIKPIERDDRKINTNKSNYNGEEENSIYKSLHENAKNMTKLNLPMISISTSENQLNCYYKSSGKSFPEVRDQFAFHGDNSAIYMWGGINPNKSNNVWSLSGGKLEWTMHISQNIPPYSRYGHTGLLYSKQFYILGGRAKENNYTFFPINLEIYNTEDHAWDSQAIFTQNGVIIQRRNHIADIIGNQMIIHGGMNENNEILNDPFLLNFSPLKIIPCSINENTSGPYLAGHSCALVIPSDIRNNIKFNIYRNLDNFVPKKSQQAIKEKGWYVFGGISKENITTNCLWILRIGRKYLEWVKPEVCGKPPSPRWCHSMNYYESRNFLIVHGGMNKIENDSFALDDTYILDLKRLEWKEVKLWSKKGNLVVQKRYNHQAQINCKLI